MGLVEVIPIGGFAAGQGDVVDRAGALEAVHDADDPASDDMAFDRIGEFVVEKDLCPAAVGFDAEFDVIVEVGDAECGQVFAFAGSIIVGEEEVDGGDAAFGADGYPDGGAFAEEVDAAELAGGSGNSARRLLLLAKAASC